MGGGASSATTEQQNLTNEATQQQMTFDQQMMQLFQKQYGNQQAILQYLDKNLQPIIQSSLKGQGMSPAALAAMRSQATDVISGEEQQAQQALNQREAQQMGGTNVLPSGVNAQLDAALLNQAAQQRSSAQLGITQYNQNLANSNLWNAINAYQGNAAQMNPLGYAGAATSGSGAIAGLSGSQASLQNSITQANNSSFFGTLGRSFASSLGSGFGFDPQQKWG